MQTKYIMQGELNVIGDAALTFLITSFQRDLFRKLLTHDKIFGSCFNTKEKRRRREKMKNKHILCPTLVIIETFYWI